MRRMSSALSVVVATSVLCVACIGGSEGTSAVPATTVSAMPTETAAEAPSVVATVTATSTVMATATATVTPTPEPVVVTVTRNVHVYVLPDRNARSLAMLPAGSAVTVTGRADGSWLAVEDFGWVQSVPEDEFESLGVPEIAVPDWWGIVGESHPLGTRTGVAHVDRVIEALEIGDTVAIDAMIVSHGFPCTTGDRAIGSPPGCPPGVADGTPLEFSVVSSCHGDLSPPPFEGTGESLLQVHDGSQGSPTVYAIVVGPRFGESYSTAYARETIVIRLSSGHARAIEVSEDGIESLSYGCELTAPSWLIPWGDEPVEYLLAPIVPAPFVAIE